MSRCGDSYCHTSEDSPKKGTQGGLMDLSLARYFLKWSWLSSTASSRSFLFLSGIACACRFLNKKGQVLRPKSGSIR